MIKMRSYEEEDTMMNRSKRLIERKGENFSGKLDDKEET